MIWLQIWMLVPELLLQTIWSWQIRTYLSLFTFHICLLRSSLQSVYLRVALRITWVSSLLKTNLRVRSLV